MHPRLSYLAGGQQHAPNRGSLDAGPGAAGLGLLRRPQGHMIDETIYLFLEGNGRS